MANTYSQIHIQFVFAVQNRQNLIIESVRESVEKYITGIVQQYGHKLISIYAMPDHLHMLTGFRTTQSISDLMREVKSGSSVYINSERMSNEAFSWQEGYGAFSYSKKELPKIIDYIQSQPEHHKMKSFREEYLELLHEFDVDFNEIYLFDWKT